MRRSVRQRVPATTEKPAARSDSPSNTELTAATETPRVSPTLEGPTRKYGTPGLKSDGAPKRPMNAFILYSNEKRSEFADQNPHLSNAQVSTLLGQSWRDMPANLKAPYVSAAKKIKEDFHLAHPDAKTRCVSRKKRKLDAANSAANRGRAQPSDSGDGHHATSSTSHDRVHYYPMYAQNFNPQAHYRGSAASASSFGRRSDDYDDEDDDDAYEEDGYDEEGEGGRQHGGEEAAPYQMSLLETLCTVAENEHTAAAQVLSALC